MWFRTVPGTRVSRCGISYRWMVRVEHGKRRPAWTGAINARTVARFFMTLVMMGNDHLALPEQEGNGAAWLPRIIFIVVLLVLGCSLGTCGFHSRCKKPRVPRYSKHGTPSSRHLGRPTLGEKQAWPSYTIESERQLANERERAEPGDARIGSTPSTPKVLIRWCGRAI